MHTGYEAFHPTLLVGMRNRLRSSARPKRLFEDTRKAAKQAGVMKDRARVVDSTAVYDAVATEDTVTQLRSAVRKLLRLLEGAEARKEAAPCARRDDDYRSPGKPPCDWDDPAARDALVDALVKDAKAALAALEGGQLDSAVAEAVELLALVAGQDVEQKEDGTFAIAKKVAKDRTISTVDPETRHGHKSHDRHFDGYKAHVCIDPDSEQVDEVSVTAGNVADRAPLDELLSPVAELAEKPAIFGDSAYADGETLERLEGQGFEVMAKVPPAVNKDGLFTKDNFIIDPSAGTVACPAGQTASVRFLADGSGIASFGQACATCPLAARCTTNSSGRIVTLHRHEEVLQAHKAAQATPEWQHAYKATRPKVERKMCATRRLVVSPTEPGGTRREVPGSDG